MDEFVLGLTPTDIALSADQCQTTKKFVVAKFCYCHFKSVANSCDSVAFATAATVNFEPCFIADL